MFKSLTSQIIVALVAGIGLGLSLGTSAQPLGEIGKIIIQLIKALAIPLVFMAIFEAVLTTHIPWRQIRRLLLIVLINGTIAAVLGLTLANLFQPGDALSHVLITPNSTPPSFESKRLDPIAALIGYIPESVAAPFVNNTVISVIILALLFGAAARTVSAPNGYEIAPLITFLLRTLEQAIHWVVKLVPIAVLGVTAKTVGEYGFTPFAGLMNYLALCISGLLIHSMITYQVWICAIAKMNLKKFWNAARKPLAYAFGTNSSLATLPLTLKTLDELGVSKSSSRLGACVGTNFNNDGILLYEVAAVIFLAQAYGLNLSGWDQLLATLLALLAAIGVAGVPEAGVISLSLVLTSVGLPLEAIPLLLTVDWIIARCRSVVNVLSDMTVSIVLNHWEQKT